jgi:hypothetical protein
MRRNNYYFMVDDRNRLFVCFARFSFSRHFARKMLGGGWTWNVESLEFVGDIPSRLIVESGFVENV